MRRVDSYIEKYGEVVGPKLYRTMQSRAGYKGVSTKLRKKIAGMKAAENPVATVGADGPKETQAMLPLSGDEASPVLMSA